MATTPSTLLTRADLDDFPDDGKRRELLDGVLIVTPAPRIDHQRVVGRIHARVFIWTETEHGSGMVLPGANVDLSPTSHLEPDIIWTPDAEARGVGFDHTPAFIVEVLSPGTRVYDAGAKKDRYAATGCDEFWIVDIDAFTIEVFHVTDGEPGQATIHDSGDTFTSPLFQSLTFDVDDLLG